MRQIFHHLQTKEEGKKRENEQDAFFDHFQDLHMYSYTKRVSISSK